MKIVKDTQKLRQISQETTIEECQTIKVFEKLNKTLRRSKTNGIGLSAIQIDIPIRALIIRCPETKIDMINPKTIDFYDPFIFYNEGCLSFQGVKINTQRYKYCEVEWLNKNGEIKRGVFGNLEAVVVQHEIDHLDGILFMDKAISKKKKIGRNEQCPCGSGKKYKRCCGR